MTKSTELERYEILEPMAGEGGYGRIDKARDIELDRTVAIKILDPLFKNILSPDDKERFKREAKTLAGLTHPNIPAIYDIQYSDDDGNDFRLITEWIDGINVRKWLSDRGVMSLDHAKRWFANICSALDHSHLRGVIHRDVKPANLIITNDSESCYIVDFGIALRSTDLDRLTSGSAVGTGGYMSPEQERGDDLGPDSDIFSLGVVLYECLSGHRPVVGDYEPLNSINEVIPPSVDDLIRNCLRSDRNLRLASASAFYRQLSKALEPHADLATTLTEGTLYDIQSALVKMSPTEFSNRPPGQQRLILSRLNDLIRVNEVRLRNVVASLLTALVRVASQSPSFSTIIKNGLNYGYQVQYGDQWWGNSDLREVINDTALAIGSDNHKVLCAAVLDMIDSPDESDQKARWYNDDLRILFQNLLANDHCTNDLAQSVGDKLDYLNELTHPARSTR